MGFISRLLFSWTFFLFLVVQHVNDSEVTKALLPFLPLVLCVVATTFLVHDLVLAQPLQHGSSETTSSSSVKWAKSCPLATTGAPVTTLTPLGVGVINRPQPLTWSGAVRECVPLALLVLAIFIALIAWGFESSRRCSRPSGFTAPSAYSENPQAPEFLYRASVLYGAPGNAATTATFQARSCNQSPAPTPPSPIVEGPLSPPEPNQEVERLLPLLGWNFTSSAFEAEDEDDAFDDDDDQLWWEAEDNQPVQIKEVPRGVVPLPSRVEGETEECEDVAPTSTPAPTVRAGSRPLIPTGRLNPNIESLQVRPNQKAIDFLSFDGEKHKDTAPTSTLVPAALGASRGRLRVLAEKPKPNLEVLQPRLGQNAIPLRSREGGDDDDDGQAARQRRPSFTRLPAPSRPLPLPPTPSPWRNPNVERIQFRTSLLACLEEEEQDEEDSLDQDRLQLSTSKPSRDASTSTTSTAVELSINATVTSASGKLLAMKKVNGEDHAATERVSRSSRLQKVLSKMSPRRFGKRFFKKKAGPI